MCYILACKDHKHLKPAKTSDLPNLEFWTKRAKETISGIMTTSTRHQEILLFSSENVCKRKWQKMRFVLFLFFSFRFVLFLFCCSCCCCLVIVFTEDKCQVNFFFRCRVNFLLLFLSLFLKEVTSRAEGFLQWFLTSRKEIKLVSSQLKEVFFFYYLNPGKCKNVTRCFNLKVNQIWFRTFVRAKLTYVMYYNWM